MKFALETTWTSKYLYLLLVQFNNLHMSYWQKLYTHFNRCRLWTCFIRIMVGMCSMKFCQMMKFTCGSSMNTLQQSNKTAEAWLSFEEYKTILNWYFKFENAFEV